MFIRSLSSPRTLPRWSALVILISGLAACASAGRALTPGQPTTLRQGQSVVLPDTAILGYLGVGADSRCRPDVQCIRAGDADVLLEFSAPGAAKRSITINTDSPAAIVGQWRVQLLSLEFGPSASATLQVDPAAR